MSKAIGNMAMHLSIDDAQVTPALNRMKQQLRDLNGTWRANVEAAKAAGDSQEAARAKVEGLENSLAKQKEILQFTNQVLENSSRETAENKNKYDAWSTSVERSAAQQRNFNNQLEHARTVLDKEETGIVELNKSIKANDELVDSQVKSFRLQGDEVSANQTKLDGLKNKQQDLISVQEKEEQILKNVSNRSGENSRAYIEQQVSVEKAKNAITQNNTELKKYSSLVDDNNVKMKELKSSYSSTKEAQDSYVTRLKAEGKVNEANIADLDKLKTAYSNLAQQYKIQVSQMNQAEPDSKAFKEVYTQANKTATEMSRLQSQARKTKTQINEMNPYGVSKIGSAFNSVGNSAKLMQDKTVSAYQYIRRNAATVALAVVGIGGAFTKGVEGAAELQNSFTKTYNLAVTGGEKAAEATKNVSQMQKDGATLAVEYGKSQSDIAAGYQELIKRGYSTSSALGAMRSEIEASVASGDDFNNVVAVSSQVLDAYNLRTDNTAQMTKNTKDVVNQLAYAADMTATDFQAMGKGMEYVGDTAHSAGIHLSETSSAIGILSNHGLEADKAGTGLRKVINSITGALSDQKEAQSGAAQSTEELNGKLEKQNQKLADAKSSLEKANAMDQSTTSGKRAAARAIERATKATQRQQDAVDKLEGKVQGVQASDMLDKLGISRDKLVDSNGNLKDLTGIMAEVNDKTKDLGTADKNAVFNALFGTTGQQAGIILAQNNQELGELNDKVKQAADGQGYVRTLAEKNMDTTTAKLKQLKSSMEQISYSLGAALLPAISDFATKLAKSLNSKEGQENLKEIAKEIGEVAHAIVETVVFMGEHIRVVEAFGIAMAGAFAVQKVGAMIVSIKRMIDWIKDATKAYETFNAVREAKVVATNNAKSDAIASAGTRTERNALKSGAMKVAPVAGATAAEAGSVGGSSAVVGGLASATVAAAPIIAIGAAVAGVSLALVAAYKHVKTFHDAVDNAGKSINNDVIKPIAKGFDYVGTSIKGAAKVFSSGFGKGFDATAGFLKDVLGDISKAFKDVSRDIGNAFSPVTKKGGFIDLVTDKLNDIGNWFSSHDKEFKAVGKVFGEVFGFIAGVVGEVGAVLIRVFGNMIPPVIKGVINLFKSAWDIVSGIFKTLWNLGVGITDLLTGNFKHAGKAFGSMLDGITSIVKGFLKGMWTIVSTAFEVGLKALDGLIQGVFGTGKNPIEKFAKSSLKAIDKFFKDANKNIKKWFSDVGKSISDYFNQTVNGAKRFGKSVAKVFSDMFNGVVKAFDWFITREIQGWKNIFNFVIDISSSLWKGTVKIFTRLWDDLTDSINKFSKWFKKIWDGISDWFGDLWNGIKKNITKIATSLWDSLTNSIKDFQKWFKKTWNNISDFFGDTWDGIKKIGSKAINSLKDTFDDVLGGIGKSFSNTWTGIKNGFKDMWDGMKQLAGDGINAVIKIPNAGIDGINGLIHDFGGPKSALGKIPKVKFATGTGAIKELTHAVLNDGNDSPETGNKETIVHPNGKMEIVQGQNTERLLLPGTEILNAKETAMFMGMQGIKHFASGTGFWGSLMKDVKGAGDVVGDVASSTWSGIKDGVDKFTKMFDYISGAISDPAGTLKKVFSPKSGGVSPVMDGVAKGAYKKTTDQATDWWKSLWSLAGDAAGGGGSSELLSNAVKFGTGKPYVWGATGPDSFDCSGLVQYTLKQMGKSFPHYSGDQFNSSNTVSDPKAGDLAFFGDGGSQHVGIYSGNGKMFSAMSPGSNPNIGYADVSSWSEKLAGYHRVPGLKSDDDKKSNDNSMTSLIKGQVGGMFDWIKKFIMPTQESAEPAGDGVAKWTDDVKKALNVLGLSTDSSIVNKVLKQINTESSGNAKAIGGNDGILAEGNATGLMQVKPGTFKAYALDGHNNIMNGYDNILAGLNYAKHTYGDSLSFLGQGHGYANGGLITQHQVAEIGEGNKPEMIIPLDGMKSSRGFELLGKTAVAMAARDGASDSTSEDSNKMQILLEQANQTNQQILQVLVAILGQSELLNQPLGSASIDNITRIFLDRAGRMTN